MFTVDELIKILLACPKDSVIRINNGELHVLKQKNDVEISADKLLEHKRDFEELLKNIKSCSEFYNVMVTTEKLFLVNPAAG